eukprot:gene18415-biopygen115013
MYHPWPRRDRVALEARIVVLMHLTDVWAQLQAREPARARDPLHTQWDWQRQVRVYWRAGDACCVRIADAELTYSHEYLGVRECLVITALTDRCYLTLSQALSMHVGGAPIGPAGTGKTETVKDLARLCGRYSKKSQIWATHKPGTPLTPAASAIAHIDAHAFPFLSCFL